MQSKRTAQACFQLLTTGFTTAIILAAVSSAMAADWPRLGGVEGAGFSTETGLVKGWGEEGPKVLWTASVGEGFAGPAVHGSEVFLLDRIPNRQDVLRCLELNTGKELWRFAYDAPGSLPFNGSRNVPTVDDQSIYTLGPLGHLHCISRKSHAPLWKAHLVDDFKDPQFDSIEPTATREQKLARAQVPMWGLTQAPLLYRDLVIVAPQTQKTGLVAYEKAAGKVRWRSDYIGRNWYSHVSPCLMKLGGVDQVIMLAQPSDPEKSPTDAPPALITSVDPNTGRILWTSKTSGPLKIPIAQPLQVSEDRLFVTGGYTFGCALLQVTQTSGRWDSELLFHNKIVAAHIHSPVLYAGRIYTISFREQGGLQSGLVCLSATGEPVWQSGPSLQFESGPFLIADGTAFVLHGKTGELSLLELAPAAPRLLAKAKVLSAKGGNAWAPMALADGRLLVRDQHELKCLLVSKGK